MRTSLRRAALLAGSFSLLAGCGSPTAPSAASSRTNQGALNRAPESVTITPGSGAVLDDGSFSDQTPPPEIYIAQEDGTLRPVGDPGAQGAPGSVDVTNGGGAVLDGGGLNDGTAPPEVTVNGVQVNNRTANATGSSASEAPHSIAITPGSGAVLNNGSATDGAAPPEVYIVQEDGSFRRVGNQASQGAPGSITITPGQGAVKNGSGNDGNPPPEVRVDGRLVNHPAPAR